jgi:hypothetical protein
VLQSYSVIALTDATQLVANLAIYYYMPDDFDFMLLYDNPISFDISCETQQVITTAANLTSNNSSRLSGIDIVLVLHQHHVFTTISEAS